MNQQPLTKHQCGFLLAALLLGPQTDKTRGTTHYVQLGSFQLAVNELKSTAIGGPGRGWF